MSKHEKINYVELPSRDLLATKDFVIQAFGWSFQDFGPEYTSFSNQGIDGGFYKAELASKFSQIHKINHQTHEIYLYRSGVECRAVKEFSKKRTRSN